MIEKKPATRESKNTQILMNFLGIVGICLNQTAAYFAAAILHLEIPYYLAAVFVFTLIFSLFIRNMSKAILYTIASMIIGALIALGILLIPSIAVEMDINNTINVFSSYAAKLMVLNLVVSIPASIIGGLISEL